MVQNLAACTHIAIDLENHSFRWVGEAFLYPALLYTFHDVIGITAYLCIKSSLWHSGFGGPGSVCLPLTVRNGQGAKMARGSGVCGFQSDSSGRLVRLLAPALASHPALPCTFPGQHSVCTTACIASFASMRQVAHGPCSRACQICALCCPHRSFQGFTCLMQISSREADWVVDTLALRPHLGPALAPLLADPAIVKVHNCVHRFSVCGKS